MRRLTIISFVVVLLSFCIITPVSARTPKPISTVPLEEVASVLDGQHHYLLLCTDVWHGTPKKLGNTDGMVLVTLDTRAHRVMLTSFIRDALVSRPNNDGSNTMGVGRINYIAKHFSPETLCDVISQHINVRIEKYILFDFTQIANIVDYLGGVDIYLNNSEIAYLRRYAVPRDSVLSVDTHTDIRKGADHPAGYYHFKGHSAVIYMRIRKAGGGGDFMRTQRARTVLSTLADQCREISWDEAEALVNNVMENNTMTNMNLQEMLQAARYAFSLRDCTVEELRIPPDGAASGITYSGMAVQEIDWEACRKAMEHYLQNSFLVSEDTEKN